MAPSNDGVLAQRHTRRWSGSRQARRRDEQRAAGCEDLVGHVGDLGERFTCRDAAERRQGRGGWRFAQKFRIGGWNIPKRDCVIMLAVERPKDAERGAAQIGRLLEHRVEHRREIAGRGVNDLQHLGGRGLLLQRLPLLVDQPRVLHRDHRLRREILQESDLFLGEWTYLGSSGGNHAEQRFVSTQRNAQQRAGGVGFHRPACDRVIGLRQIANMAETTALNQWPCRRVVGGRVTLPQHISKGGRQSADGNRMETHAVVKFQAAPRDIAETVGAFQNGVEYRHQIAPRAIDHL